ncbi:MAG: Pyruvate, water dikinase, partial [uncultured bacterium]
GACLDKVQAATEEGEVFFNKILPTLKDVSNSDLNIIVKKFHTLFLQIQLYGDFTYYMSEALLNQKLAQALEARLGLGSKDIQNIMGVLSNFDHLSFLEREKLELAKIAISGDSLAIEIHIARWRHKTFDYWGPITPDQEFHDRFQEYQKDKQKTADIVKKLSEYHKEQTERKNAIIEKFNLSDEIVLLGKLVSQVGFLNDAKKYGVTRFTYLFDMVLDEISLRFGQEKELLYYYMANEIEEMVENGTVISNEKINKRMQWNVLVFENGENSENITDLESRISQDLKKFLSLEKNPANNSKGAGVVCSGLPASSGEYTGVVVTMFSHNDINKAKEGMVLVSPKTTVDFITAMYKSGAVVTDYGGLTSHPAIVAREMGIPAVVGTGDATRRFHDGDVVRVDGERGVVSLLDNKTANFSKYTFAWQEKSSFMIIEANVRACQKSISEIFNVNFRDIIFFYRDNQAYFYFSNEDIARWEEEGKKFLKANYLNKFLIYTKQIKEKFYKVIENINGSKLSSLSNEEILHLFDNYFSVVTDAAGIYLGSTPEAMFATDRELKKILQKCVPKEKLDEVYATICAPSEIDFIQQEKIDWLVLMKKKKVTKEELIKHANKYAANFFNTYSVTITLDYLQQRKKNTDIDELKKEVIRIKNQVRSSGHKRTVVLNKLPKQAGKLSQIIATQAVERLSLKNCWQGAEFLAIELFIEISRRAKIDIEKLFMAYGAGDIRNFLQKGNKLSNEEIENRKDALVFKIDAEKEKIISGKQAQADIETFFEGQNLNDMEHVRGMSATNVSVVGRAYVMLVEGIAEFAQASKKFQKGDILITTMTSPNMMLLFEKVGGVVTNEGGVCSHAAVVSRELNKPCVVGTHNATRFFKTGDYVYIDAASGEVRKVDKEFYNKNRYLLNETRGQKQNILQYVRPQISHHPAKKSLIMNFAEISKEDLLSVGGKGASLGEMFEIFPVPAGFCLTTYAFNKFIKELRSEIAKKLSRINYHDSVDVEEVTARIRLLILELDWPASIQKDIIEAYRKLIKDHGISVSVRSSATAEDLPQASFAGQQDTFLYIEGEESFNQAIKGCFASLYSARATLYRHKNNISEKDLAMAVVVQRMIDPVCAGVGFSVNPVSKNSHEVLIEAALGVGEHVVSGSHTPDTYVYNLNEDEFKKDISGSRQTLTDSQIIELVSMIKAIEKHYKYPQDVEWALDRAGKFWILQSRPITTL